MLESIEIWMWIVGIAIPVVLAALRLWWRVEQGQNESIAALRDGNHKDHIAIRKELAATKAQMNDQHMALMDKVTEVWKHLVKSKGD